MKLPSPLKKIYTITQLHPATWSHCQKGHPWITADSYTQKFPVESLFLKVTHPKEKWHGTFLHDPKHSKVKARWWSPNIVTNAESWLQECFKRMESARQNRTILISTQKRDHYYLVFGEADELPGLFITYLNGHLLIQTYAYYWEYFLEDLIQYLILKKWSPLFGQNIWWQTRSGPEQKPALMWDGQYWTKNSISLNVKEQNAVFSITLGKWYDHHLYTDMASIRERLFSPDIAELGKKLWYQKSILNLFSYTGSFSIRADLAGAQKITSVDVSHTYQEILKKNIHLNKLDLGKHQLDERDILASLNDFAENGIKFDTIILDPPSSFTSQKKRVQAQQLYPMMLKLIKKILAPQGVIICFSNQHQVTWTKFESLLSPVFPTLKEGKNKFKLELSQDCPKLTYFPEGDYLKGFYLFP